MRRPKHLVELGLILVVIACLAAYQRSQQPAPLDDPSYQQLRLQLQKDWLQGDLQACQDRCKELLKQDSGDRLALRYLGLLAMRANQPEKALEYFDRGLAGQAEWSPYLEGQRLGALYRERGRLHVSQRRWSQALEDAKKAQELLNSWSEDHDLARDVQACAQYGAGNISLAKMNYPEPSRWNDNPINALIVKHAKKLNGTDEASRYSPTWHPTSCPLCK